MRHLRNLFLFVFSLVFFFLFVNTSSKAACGAPSCNGNICSCAANFQYYCFNNSVNRVTDCCDLSSECPTDTWSSINGNYQPPNPGNIPANTFVCTRNNLSCVLGGVNCSPGFVSAGFACMAGGGCITTPLPCVPANPPAAGIVINPRIFCGTTSMINTAIGCIPIGGSLSPTISTLLTWSLGIAGGIAFILLIIAGFQYVTSAGDPKRAKAAQELLTSAIAGLIFIALSVLILNFIGVRLLGLNQLGFTPN